ncbi:hypothetical protein ACNPMZ_06980 [Acinetobacter pittii]|uniref:Methyltransferase type 11 domain-containing protein n=1 Tax=Acinetobacter courvalinii TaxID=280147 RepID=N9RBJ8_9GAMM|nr:hypothetical protein [Acinetobacter courvalinii]ENX39756.1 hypothetical protein F888_01242 [Acinetobacter courvalinii]KAB0659755.1 class I SAM-dependent methyltransferase [Acinetobacter courvalinii]GGH41190.1 hypothetical protein GCM10007354_28250 [Acinetobacter courvalinii]
MAHQKICEGVFQVKEKGDPSIEIEGKKYIRLMDFFYIEVPADELELEQVSKLCQARVSEKRCFEGANKDIKNLFNKFLLMHKSKSILEVGAGTNPILTENEAKENEIIYMTSDADTYEDISFHFDAKTDLPSTSFFDVVIALFVLHFRFYEHQISQIFKHIKEDGIFLANVYNRTNDARKILETDFMKAGFYIEFFEDPNNTCRDHYYLLASKNPAIIITNKEILFSLIKLEST